MDLLPVLGLDVVARAHVGQVVVAGDPEPLVRTLFDRISPTRVPTNSRNEPLGLWIMAKTAELSVKNRISANSNLRPFIIV